VRIQWPQPNHAGHQRARQAEQQTPARGCVFARELNQLRIERVESGAGPSLAGQGDHCLAVLPEQQAHLIEVKGISGMDNV